MQTNNVVTKQDIFISKTLSWLLRHEGVKQGLVISSDGFVAVPQLLNCKHLQSNCTIDDIKRVVVNNNKQRFTLRTNKDGVLEIRANQGHSIKNVDLNLLPINDPNKVENVIHGTYLKYWTSIKNIGLFRGKRNHIHFAIGLPNDENVISGIRKTAEIYIYINLKKALDDNLLFFLSSNNVVLSPGNGDGYILTKYFSKVILASDGTELK